MISLIIPHCNQLNELLHLLSSIAGWDLQPDEIIIVDSSLESFSVNKRIINVLELQGVKFKIINLSNAYPGEARNIGCKNSEGEFLAFLDVKTIPKNDWLHLTLNQLLRYPDVAGVFGGTHYIAKNKLAKLIKLATYGVYPLRTLPGSVIRRDTMITTGQFIQFTRAGEDTDWMIRIKLHNLNMLDAKSIIYYHGLDELKLSSLLKKWFRNYKHSAALPYLYAHKSIYYHALMIFLLFAAFNWNWVIAGWDTDSSFYIPHFTKIIFTSFLILYIYVRGLMIPRKKGASWKDLLPFGWIFVAGISALLDLTKILAFAAGRWMRV